MKKRQAFRLQGIRTQLGVLALLLIPVVASAQNSVETTIAVRKIDWILLNARVDLLADALAKRFPPTIQPPVYRYDSKTARISALSIIDPRIDPNSKRTRDLLAETSKVFCLQPHLPESLLSGDPLPDIPCTAEFFQIQHGSSVSIASFNVPAPRR